MSQNQTFNNVVYPIPTKGDINWGPSLTRYLAALGTYAFSPAGGTYTLTADLNLGASFGVLAAYFKSGTSNIATAGFLRLAHADALEWRNNANSGNLALTVDSSDRLNFNGSPVQSLLSLPDGQIFIGNVSNVPTAQTLSGAITTTDTGVTSISANYITNSMVNSSAAIAYSKLNLTGSILNSDIFSGAGIVYSKLSLTNSIVNADIASAAAIAYSKLNLSGSIVNADISTSAAIAYSKLSLTGSIVNADISASAAIAYSKLALTGSIVNADISASAAIAVSKLAALTASKVVLTDGSGVLTTGTPSVTQGGTGLTTVAQGDILYGSASNTLSSLAKNVTATRYLSNTGTSNNPAWAQVDLSNGVTGNLSVNNLNSGTSASSSTFWRGDGTWASPSGSGTVNSGTAPRLAFYATSGTAVSDISADASMNSHKITNLANGSASTDAAAFGQIPTITDWTAYTPTITGCGTVSSKSFFWKQIGDTIYVTGGWQCGTVSAAVVSITLPNSTTINYSKLNSASFANLGTSTRTPNSGSGSYAAADNLQVFSISDNTLMFLGNTWSAGAQAKTLGSTMFANSDWVTVSFWYPKT